MWRFANSSLCRFYKKIWTLFDFERVFWILSKKVDSPFLKFVKFVIVYDLSIIWILPIARASTSGFRKDRKFTPATIRCSLVIGIYASAHLTGSIRKLLMLSIVTLGGAIAATTHMLSQQEIWIVRNIKFVFYINSRFQAQLRLFSPSRTLARKYRSFLAGMGTLST